MNKLKIEDHEGFEFASAVVKESKTGFSSNRRLLVIRGGHLYYFSNVPSFFDGNPKTLEYHHELPKHSLQLLNIRKIKPNEVTSTSFEIVFNQMHLMEREDIRKMLIEGVEFTPKKKSEETVWKFTCDSNLIKSKWVSYLAQLREHFSKQSEGEMNWELDNKSENRSSVSNLSNTTKTPWRESTVLRKQYSVNDVKSMADLEGRDMEMDMYFDRPPSKKFELNRLTSSYSHEINLEDFAMEEEKGLTMTTPGLKMDMKMKKMGSTNAEVNLKKIY